MKLQTKTGRTLFSAIILAFCLNCSAVLAYAGSLDRQSLHDELKQLWDSLSTLEFRSESYEIDSRGRPDRTKTFISEYAVAPGGRLAVKVYFGGNGQAPKLVQDARYDGTHRIDVQTLPDEPKTVDMVRVTNRSDREHLFDGHMNEVLWLFAPDGKPVDTYIKDDAEIDVRPGPDGGENVVVACDIPRGRTLRFELAPDHDYLPRRVELRAEGVEHIYEVTRFGRDNGRWFPVEGTKLTRDGQGVKRRRFEVDGLRINRTIAASTFTMPRKLEDGAVILDRTSLHRSRVVGGPDARIEFVERHPASFAEEAEGEPIVASRSPARFPTALVLGSVSLGALVLAAIIYHLRGRDVR